MNKNKIGAKVLADKDSIIERYTHGTDIVDLSEEYGMTITTLLKKLKKWGIKSKPGDYKKKVKNKAIYKLDFSRELKEKIRVNTEINRQKVKHINGERTEEQRLVHFIIQHPIMW